MKPSVVLLCLLAIALPAAAAEIAASSGCAEQTLVSPSGAPAVELPWLAPEPLTSQQAFTVPDGSPAPVLLAHPCCPSNHSQICSAACGGCGRGVCDDGACECLCC